MNIKEILTDIYNKFTLNLKTLILFEMIYKILVFIIFTPLIAFVMKVSIMGMGFFNLTNNELINLGLSVPGVIGIILILILSFITIFIEMGMITYIANKSYKNQTVDLLEGLINVIRILPRTLGVCILTVLFMAIILGPISGIGLTSTLIRDLSIPLFIKLAILKTPPGKFILGIAIVIGIAVSLRWILSIPIIIIENTNLRGALKKSKAIYKKQKLNIIKYLLIWIFVNIIFRGIPLFVYMVLGKYIVHGSISIKLYLSIFVLWYTISSIITLPLFITFLVEIYYECRSFEADSINLDVKHKFENNKIYRFINNHKKHFSILTVVLFLIMVFYTSFNVVYKYESHNKVSITAHRGYSRMAPENSIPSIERAIDIGADYSEIDVMTTKDNHVVLFHDPTLMRFDETKRKIKNMTLEEVKTIDIGSYFGESKYIGEQVPTLEEVFKKFKGKMKFNIELKPSGKNDDLANEVAKLIKKYKMEDEVVVSSLDYNCLMKFKSENTGVKVGYILTFGFGDFSKMDVDFISVEYGMLSRDLVDTMHKMNKEVHVWTLNNQEEMINAVVLGVDNIITDDVWGAIATLMTLDFREDIGSEDVSADYETWFYINLRYLLKYVNI